MNPISLTEAETNLLTQMVTLARPFRTEPYLIVNRVGDLTETSRLRPCNIPEGLEDQYRRWTIATAPLKVDVQGVSMIPPYSSLNAFSSGTVIERFLAIAVSGEIAVARSVAIYRRRIPTYHWVCWYFHREGTTWTGRMGIVDRYPPEE